jgi:hypothetical protein
MDGGGHCKTLTPMNPLHCHIPENQPTIHQLLTQALYCDVHPAGHIQTHKEKITIPKTLAFINIPLDVLLLLTVVTQSNHTKLKHYKNSGLTNG